MTEIKIQDKFKHLSAFLIGNPRQFLVVSGNTYCVRESCEECPYTGNGCEFKTEKISAVMIPPARRAIGLEEKPFLVLQLLPGKEFRKLQEGEINENVVPESLWNNPRDVYSLDERNLHFVLSDRTKKFRVLKGQFRFYGDSSEFANSEYAKYFKVYNKYQPEHHLMAFDYSAIEPRGYAIASREPLWEKIYEGVPKTVIKLIEPSHPFTGKESHIYVYKNKTFCFLLGELDKVSFEKQCKNCKTPCKVIKEYKKNIPGDFHSLNAKAFFSSEPDWPNIKEGEQPTPAQSDILSKYRNISKICGLAAGYGGSAWTLAHNMNCSPEEAQKRLDNFFSALTQVRKTMLLSEQRTLTTGKVQNFFGRICDVSRWAFSKAQTEKERRQDKGYAVRIGYNYPIQSSMTELLKIAMIRIDETIFNNKWNPLYGCKLLQNIQPYSYTDILCTTLLSIHDELDFLLRTDSFDSLIPEIYKVLQVTDIIKSLGVDFLLEMDVEYDLTRSFTATTKYPSAKIHLFNSVLPSIEKEINCVPNMLLVDFEKINKENLKKVLNFFEVFDNIEVENSFFVGIQNKGEVYVMPRKITESGLKEILSITGGRKACYQG